MNAYRFFTLLVCGVGLIGSSVVFAAKAKTTDNAVPAAKYDADNNGLLQGAEKEALIKAFKDGSDPAVKIYDLNRDGELTADEVGQISLAGSEPSKTKKPKKEKKPKKPVE